MTVTIHFKLFKSLYFKCFNFIIIKLSIVPKTYIPDIVKLINKMKDAIDIFKILKIESVK